MQTNAPLAAQPESIAPYLGRILDADSHEMMPAQAWVQKFGEVARPGAPPESAGAHERYK